MASLPRAQYRLPLMIRNIVDCGDFYNFGGQLARRDMTPIGFDRASPLPISYEVASLSLKGAGGTIIRPENATLFLNIGQNEGQYLAGAQFLFGMGPQGGPYLSTAGVTAGQKFVMATDSLCQVTDAGDMVLKSTLPRTGTFWRNTGTQERFIEHAQIIAENATTFFVYIRTSVVTYESTGNTTYAAQRMRILNVDKTTWAWSTSNIWATNTSTTQSTANVAVPNGSTDAFQMNKGFRYLTTLGDGRLVFAHYPFNFTGFLSATQIAYRYFTFDPVSGSIQATRYYQPITTSRYTLGVPTGLLAKNPVGLDVEGVYYVPETLAADDTYQVRMMVLPKNLPTTLSVAAYDPQVNTALCTITGMPAGLTLLAPGDVDSSNTTKGQVSAWLVKDGGEDFLVCYGHNNGIMGRDTEAYTPVARHQMVVFKIDATDPSKLTYVKHYNDAFGYGVVLSQLTGSADGKTIVVYNGSGFGILTWNSVTKSYTVSQYRGIPSGITRLHLDTSGQIWVEDVDTKVYVFNLDLSATVDVQYVGNPVSLNYSGTTIEQEVDVTAFSFAGDRIVRTCRLVLKGATFDDGTVQKTITTSATAATRVKIFVNGSGNVSFDAFLQ